MNCIFQRSAYLLQAGAGLILEAGIGFPFPSELVQRFGFIVILD